MLWGLCALAAWGAPGCLQPTEREPQDLLPYLQRPTSTSITIQWRTVEEKDSEVHYGREPFGPMWILSDPRPVQRHSMTLEDLSPDTTYVYQVYSGGVQVGGTASFRTAPEGVVPFVFDVLGDTMYRHPEKFALEEQILADRPAFVLHVGDIAASDGGFTEKVWQWYLFEDYAELLQVSPLIPVLGNHEYQAVLNALPIPGGAQIFHDYFTLPGNERWFSFDWANCHFIGLDVNIPVEVWLGRLYGWLAEDLRKATDGIDDPDWIFVYWHQPVYSSGVGHLDVMCDDLRRRYVPLLEEAGVAAVFNGHDHFYERSFRNGVYYIVTGGGGVNQHPIFPGLNPYSQVALNVYQYMRLSVDGREVLVEAVGPDGETVDAFTLSR